MYLDNDLNYIVKRKTIFFLEWLLNFYVFCNKFIFEVINPIWDLIYIDWSNNMHNYNLFLYLKNKDVSRVLIRFKSYTCANCSYIVEIWLWHSLDLGNNCCKKILNNMTKKIQKKLKKKTPNNPPIHLGTSLF